MIVADPKAEKLEHRIKELNAIRGEYRTEIDEAEAQFKRRKITKEELDRIRSKCEEKMEQIERKGQRMSQRAPWTTHQELDRAIMIVPEPCSNSGTLFLPRRCIDLFLSIARALDNALVGRLD